MILRISLTIASALAGTALACSSVPDRPMDGAVTDAGLLADPDGAPPSQSGGDLDSDPSCAGTVANPPVEGWNHVPDGTPVVYASNPPSSGPHYPVWASYGTHATAVDRGYYVHNLEHGAVVVLYRCAVDDDCASIVRELEAVDASLPADPGCTADPALKRRIVVTPDPLLDVPIAAAAWGWTYKARCVDAGGLRDFIRAHYGQGRESTCSDGAQL